MSATRDNVHTILRQLFVRNMSASDADEAADRFIDLYFSDGAVDMSDSNLSALNLSSAGNCNAATVNATTAVNTVTCRASTSMNTATVNATTAVNTVAFVATGNATANNLIATNYCNAATVNATTAVNTVALVATANVSANNLVATNYANVGGALIKTDVITFTNVNGDSCVSANAIQAGWFVIGIAANVTSNVAGATAINVGDGSDDDEFCILAANTVGSNCGWNGTAHTPELVAANTNVVLTPITANFDGNGNVQVFITYMKSAY